MGKSLVFSFVIHGHWWKFEKTEKMLRLELFGVFALTLYTMEVAYLIYILRDRVEIAESFPREIPTGGFIKSPYPGPLRTSNLPPIRPAIRISSGGTDVASLEETLKRLREAMKVETR